MTPCSFPVRVEDGIAVPCNRPARAYFLVGRTRLFRCFRHDNPAARRTAEEGGYARVEIGVAA